MKENYECFVDGPFDCRKIEKLDIDAIDAGIEEGKQLLSYQYDSIMHTNANCRMILSWIIGAMMALTGAMMASALSETPDIAVMVISGYELIFAFVIAVIIIGRGMYMTTTFFPGDSPTHLFSDRKMAELDGYDSDRTKYLKGWYLDELQFRIMQNDKVQAKKTATYRLSLILCLSAMLSGGVLLVVLLLLGF